MEEDMADEKFAVEKRWHHGGERTRNARRVHLWWQKDGGIRVGIISKISFMDRITTSLFRLC